jgi:hypothetical protein
MHHLSDAFPGVTFGYEAEEPAAVASVRANLPIFWRLWFAVFGVDIPYPRHMGLFERVPQGGTVQF